MSVLIKGMEMPISCAFCRFSGAYCYAKGDEDAHSTAPCPLVPVQKHGRLIDADAFAAEMKKRQDACAEWKEDIKNGGGYGTELYYRADSFWGAMCETKLTLDKIPTIIPAEEET